MSSPIINNTEMVVETPQPIQGVDQELIEELGQLLDNVPKIVVTTEQEGPALSINHKDNEFRSVFGESDMLSIIQDRDDSEKERSEADTKIKSIKKCYNKKCQSTKDVKKLKSRAFPGKFRIFCKPCYQYYSTNQFCEFCEQVYDNSALNQQDDNNWMGCDSCQRWNHVQCQYQKRNKKAYQIKQKDDPYLCKECTEKKLVKYQYKRQKANSKQDDYYVYEKPPTSSKRTQRLTYTQQKQQQYSNSNPDSINIFRKPKEINLYLDSFLNSFNSSKLAINDNQIKDDFRKINCVFKDSSKNYAYDKGK